MSTLHALLHPAPHEDRSSAPLLFLFLIPMLAVVGLIVWLASGPTWGFVGAALLVTIVLLGGIVVAIVRRLNDDEDDR
jgi:hypothetical protein